MKPSLEKLVAMDGIAAAWLAKGSSDPVIAVAERTNLDQGHWGELFVISQKLLDVSQPLTHGAEIRVQLQDYTIVMVKEDDTIIALATIQAHPIVKSVKRMMRKTLAKAKEVPSAAAQPHI